MEPHSVLLPTREQLKTLLQQAILREQPKEDHSTNSKRAPKRRKGSVATLVEKFSEKGSTPTKLTVMSTSLSSKEKDIMAKKIEKRIIVISTQSSAPQKKEHEQLLASLDRISYPQTWKDKYQNSDIRTRRTLRSKIALAFVNNVDGSQAKTLRRGFFVRPVQGALRSKLIELTVKYLITISTRNYRPAHFFFKATLKERMGVMRDLATKFAASTSHEHALTLLQKN